VEDDFCNLWMTGRFGIFRVNKKNLDDFDHKRAKSITSISYNKQDGLAAAECTAVAKPGGWKSHDGRLWFPTSKGLAVIDPKVSLKINELPPPVVIEEILADKKSVTSDGWRVTGNHDTQHSSPVTI